MSLIYIATNLKNSKQYVGQTVGRLRQRISQHKTLKKNYPITKAIKKYGTENFKWVSFSCPEEEMDWQETFLIKELNTLVPNGYNLDSGGNKQKHRHEISKQKMRENHWDCGGEKHPMFGTHRTGEENPMYGKTQTPEAIEKIRKKIVDRFKNPKNREHQSQIRIERKLSRGENNPSAKLTETDVLKIKSNLKENNLTINQIAEIFKINRRTISAIKHNKIWRYL